MNKWGMTERILTMFTKDIAPATVRGCGVTWLMLVGPLSASSMVSSRGIVRRRLVDNLESIDGESGVTSEFRNGHATRLVESDSRPSLRVNPCLKHVSPTY